MVVSSTWPTCISACGGGGPPSCNSAQASSSSSTLLSEAWWRGVRVRRRRPRWRQTNRYSTPPCPPPPPPTHTHINKQPQPNSTRSSLPCPAPHSPQAGRQAGRQVGKHVGRQADRQADRQTFAGTHGCSTSGGLAICVARWPPCNSPGHLATAQTTVLQPWPPCYSRIWHGQQAGASISSPQTHEHLQASQPGRQLLTACESRHRSTAAPNAASQSGVGRAPNSPKPTISTTSWLPENEPSCGWTYNERKGLRQAVASSSRQGRQTTTLD